MQEVYIEFQQLFSKRCDLGGKPVEELREILKHHKDQGWRAFVMK